MNCSIVKMHKLAQLQQRIKQLNKSGLKRLEEKEYIKAQKYFNQCQNILEHAASCGRDIDRGLVIAVLNNQACVFQKINELQKLMDYVEAILFNISSYLQLPETQQLVATCLNIASNVITPRFQQMQQLKIIILRKQQYSKYLLLFAQQQKIRSQYRQAIITANKSKQQMMQSIELAYNYLILTSDTQNIKIKQLLKQLTMQPKQISSKEYNDWVQKFNFIIISNTEGTFQCQFTVLYDQLVNQQKKEISLFSYQNIFQITPKHIQGNKSIDNIFNPFQMFMNVYHLAGCIYFLSLTLKTLVKIEAPQNNLYLMDSIEIKRVETKRNMKLANIYEFYSIILLMQLIGCQNQMLGEIVQAYNTNQQLLQRQQQQEREFQDTENEVKQLSKKYENYLIEVSPAKEMQLGENGSKRMMIGADGENEPKKMAGVDGSQQLKSSNKLIQFLTPYNANNKINNEFMFELPSIQSIEISGSFIHPQSKLDQKILKTPQQLPSSQPNLQQQEQEEYPYFSKQQFKSYSKINHSTINQSTLQDNNSNIVAKTQKICSSILPEIKEHNHEGNRNRIKKQKPSSSKNKNLTSRSNTKMDLKKCVQFQKKSTKNSSQKSVNKVKNSKSIKFNPLHSTKGKTMTNIFKSQKIPNPSTKPDKTINLNTKSSLKQLTFNSIKMNKVKSPPRISKVTSNTNIKMLTSAIVDDKNNNNLNKLKSKSKSMAKNISKSKSTNKVLNKKSPHQQKGKEILYCNRR